MYLNLIQNGIFLSAGRQSAFRVHIVLQANAKYSLRELSRAIPLPRLLFHHRAILFYVRTSAAVFAIPALLNLRELPFSVP